MNNKKLISYIFFVCCLLFVVNPVLANQTDTEDKTQNAIAAEFAVNEALGTLGLSVDDFKDIPQKSADFYNGMGKVGRRGVSRVVGEGWEAFWDKVNNKANNDAEKWQYAYKMAKINESRDPNAGNIEHETVYMYMSHFVDIRTGIIDTVIPEYSDDIYYSAWIVNDDRQTYDTFLNGVLHGQMVYNGISTLEDVADDIETIATLTGYEGSLGKAQRMGQAAFMLQLANESSHINWKDTVKQATSIYNNASSYQEFKDGLDEYFEMEDNSELITDYFAEVFVNGEISGNLFTANGIMNYFHKVQMLFSKDLIDKYRWISLIQYNNMRVSQRMMRYYSQSMGLDF